MPTGLYTRWENDAEKKRLIPSQNRRRRFENMVVDHLQNTRPACKIQSNHTTWNQYKIDNFSVDGFCGHCNSVFEAMGCFYHGCNCQMAKKEANAHIVKFWQEWRTFDAERKIFIIGKGFEIVEVWECLRWKQVRDDKTLKGAFEDKFPISQTFVWAAATATDRQWFTIWICSMRFISPQKPSKLLSVFKNGFVSKSDIDEYMNSYADQQGLLQQPSRRLNSSFHLENGCVITPLFNFYRRLGLECTRVHRFVEYTPEKCFKGFVKSVVDARRLGDQNKNSTVVAETMKFLSISSYGYQIMDRSIASIRRQNTRTRKRLTEP